MSDLLSFFLRRLPEAADAADALGDTLVLLWAKRTKAPESEQEQRMWAFGFARNVLANTRRKSSRWSSMTTELVEAATVAHRGRRPDPDLERALAELAPDDRDLVLLVAWEGFGVAEAGELLGLKPEASRARYSRARARLRALLA